MTKRTPPFSLEVCERAVRMAQDHQGEHSSRQATIRSIASKIGCSGEILHNWIKEAENSKDTRASPGPDERERIKALEREVRELRPANEISSKESTYSAMAELDRRSRT